MAIMLLTPAIGWRSSWGLGCPPIFKFGGSLGALCAVIMTVHFSTPAISATSFSAAARTGSIRAPISAGTSKTNRTAPASMFTPRTISALTISLPSGNCTRVNSDMISLTVIDMWDASFYVINTNFRNLTPRARAKAQKGRFWRF